MDLKEDKIKVLVIAPQEYPEVKEIDNTLETMQNIVNGYIEEYCPFYDDVALVCNEEGKFTGEKPNRAIYDGNNIIDIIYGTFFICKVTDDNENFQSLTPDMIDRYTKIFKEPEYWEEMGY